MLSPLLDSLSAPPLKNKLKNKTTGEHGRGVEARGREEVDARPKRQDLSFVFVFLVSARVFDIEKDERERGKRKKTKKTLTGTRRRSP